MTYFVDKIVTVPVHGRAILKDDLNKNQFVDVGFGFRRTKDIKIVTVTEEEREVSEETESQFPDPVESGLTSGVSNK